jgi:hypothetical protein
MHMARSVINAAFLLEPLDTFTPSFVFKRTIGEPKRQCSHLYVEHATIAASVVAGLSDLSHDAAADELVKRLQIVYEDGCCDIPHFVQQLESRLLDCLVQLHYAKIVQELLTALGITLQVSHFVDACGDPAATDVDLQWLFRDVYDSRHMFDTPTVQQLMRTRPRMQWYWRQLFWHMTMSDASCITPLSFLCALCDLSSANLDDMIDLFDAWRNDCPAYDDADIASVVNFPPVCALLADSPLGALLLEEMYQQTDLSAVLG